MTGYIVREPATRRVWTGIPNDWSPLEAEAQVFEHAGIATAAAFLHCRHGLDVDVEPVFVDQARARALGFAA